MSVLTATLRYESRKGIYISVQYRVVTLPMICGIPEARYYCCHSTAYYVTILSLTLPSCSIQGCFY